MNLEGAILCADDDTAKKLEIICTSHDISISDRIYESQDLPGLAEASPDIIFIDSTADGIQNGHGDIVGELRVRSKSILAGISNITKIPSKTSKMIVSIYLILG